MTQLMAVTDAMKDAAGLLVWWELTGLVDLDDLREALDEQFGAGRAMIPPDELELGKRMQPEAPSKEVALARAAASVLTSKRQLLRPLSRRGAWEIVLEKVELVSEDAATEARLAKMMASSNFDDDDFVTPEERAAQAIGKRERCTYTSQLSGWVERADGQRHIVIHGDEALKKLVLGKLGMYERVLTPTDFSSWLLSCANRLHAVGLRDRGGFYFIPKDRVEIWKRLVAVVQACSKHVCREIPAMRTEEAVEAILAAVTSETCAEMDRLERYLAKGDAMSTKGLNAEERAAERVRQKLVHYCEVLGKRIPDLETRLEQLTGAITAAKVVAKGEAAQ